MSDSLEGFRVTVYEPQTQDDYLLALNAELAGPYGRPDGSIDRDAIFQDFDEVMEEALVAIDCPLKRKKAQQLLGLGKRAYWKAREV